VALERRQRVAHQAIARHLAERRPASLVLWRRLQRIEPAKLRRGMQSELKRLQRETSITFVLVTHDQDEAMAMGDQVAVFNAGRIVQVGEPREVYLRPNSRFVADFIGSVNIFEGKLTVDEPEQAVVDCPEVGRVFLNHGVTGAHDTTVWVAIRPEKITMLPAGKAKAKDSPDGHNIAHGQIKGLSYLGDVTVYEVRLESGRSIRVSRPNLSRWDQEDFSWDDKVSLHWHPTSPIVLLS
jgi:spermidine/putrescine transport system ATP-binding protein/putrescine transport system ATP-binding protein